MITVLSAGANAATDPYKVKEVWGYDNYGGSGTNGKFQNCYEREVNSAMFVGGEYIRGYSAFSGNNYNVNRVLGQKAKSYIQKCLFFRRC